MEPEGLLPHSQVSATCLYPEPAQSSPYVGSDIPVVCSDIGINEGCKAVLTPLYL
jgi:hypothetical protein